MDLSECGTKGLRLQSHISRKKHIKHSESCSGSPEVRNRMKYMMTTIITIKETKLWLFSNNSHFLRPKQLHVQVQDWPTNDRDYSCNDKRQELPKAVVLESMTAWLPCLGKNKWLPYPVCLILFAGFCDVFLHLLGSLIQWGTTLPTAGHWSSMISTVSSSLSHSMVLWSFTMGIL